MKAAILKSFSEPLAVETMADPILGTGEVIVEIVAAGVVAYANEVFNGTRPYLLKLPLVPGAGAIGRVRAFGPDATRLQIGDWVYCDPTVRSRDDALSPDIALQGLTAGSPGGLRLQDYFHDGSFAELIRVPTENVTRIGAIDHASAPYWCRLGTLAVPYGGLFRADLQAGETVLINGATGTFGGAAVAVALAMGAACVMATGRNERTLGQLAERFGPRLRPIAMGGDEEEDRARILAAAPAPIDCVLDLLPPMASPVQVRTAVMAVRPYGRVALMGGVGTASGPGLELPYSWIMRNCITIHGQWMFRPEAIGRIAAMVRAGLIDLRRYEVTQFSLQQANQAVAHAAAHAGPFNVTVIVPSRKAD